jgi:putative peptide zinc metalloprotease protein
MSEKPKPELELLIRAPGAAAGSKGGFVTKRYVANQVALTVKPKRIPEDSYEVQAQSRKDRKLFYVIRQLEADRYLFLNEEEYFLWQTMDGLHTLRDVATAYFLKFGSFDFRVIQRFLARAREHKLIVIPQTDLVRRTLEPEERASLPARLLMRLRSLDLRMSNVDERIGALYERLGFLFTRPAFVAYALLLALGTAALLLRLRSGGLEKSIALVDGSHMLLLPVFLLLHAAAVVVHELAHALACKHFGREVKSFGFTFLNRLFPSVYADVTDMWMSTRRARMAVSFAGPLSGLLIGSLSGIVAFLLPRGTAAAFFWLFGATCMGLAASNLHPFLFVESDGYHILSDFLRIPALREHSRRFLQGRVESLRTAQKPRPMTPDERAFLAYGLASIASIIGLCLGAVAMAAYALL